MLSPPDLLSVGNKPSNVCQHSCLLAPVQTCRQRPCFVLNQPAYRGASGNEFVRPHIVVAFSQSVC